MEEPQSAQSGKLLRYALRSVTKPKEEKPPAAELSNPSASASKRGRPASNVSKSVSVLDISGKDKPVKPPRRLSVPNKAAGTPAPKLGGNITPISEARSRRSAKSETPAASDASRLTSRKKFSILSSESYWLSQIKLSEAAGKHSVSLGFFKLALEAGCEQPLQRLRDELKSYALRHKLGDADLAVPLKELFESYGVVENEQLQVSETCSHVPEEGTRSSDEDAKSSSSTMGTRKLKPKSLNTDAAQVSPVKNTAKKEIPQKSTPATRTRASVAKKSSTTPGPVSDSGMRRSTAKKPQNPIKQEAKNEKDRKKQGNKSAVEQGSSVSATSAEEALNENKENEDAASMEEISLTEVA
ncbi:hypothetical protein ABKV19_011374 [Rosa sericea]